MAITEKEANKTNKKTSCSYEYFDKISCHRSPMPGENFCILHSENVKKDEALFINTFEAELIRQKQRSRETSNTLAIEGIVFPIPLIFASVWQRFDFSLLNARNATFLKPVNFHMAELRKDAIFVDATFHDLAIFTGASFDAGAYFSNATFLDSADFSTVKFIDKAYFVETVFEQKTSFFMAEFNIAANFTGACFAKEVKFNNSILNNILFDRTNFGWGTLFSSSDLSKVEFRNTNVSHCEFVNSVGLEDCYFRHVSWENKKIIPSVKELFTKDFNFNWIKWFSARRNKRWIIADEIKQFRLRKYQSFFDKPNREQENTGKINAIETTYRELKVNYEKHKNFPDAGHFHYGELEMRRIKKGWRRFFSLAEAYWLLSGYGERWQRAFIGLVVIILIFGFIYSKQGFTLPKEATKVMQIKTKTPIIKLQQPKPKLNTKLQQAKLNEVMIIDTRPPFLIIPKPKPINDFTEGLILSVKVALFRTDSFLQATKTSTHVLMILEMTIAPIVLGLLIIAISRQFKRS